MVLLLLVLAMGIAAFSSMRSQGVTTIVRRDSYQEVCRELSRFAATEAVQRLRQRADLPADPFAALLRSESSGELSLGPAELPVTARELALVSGYTLAGVTVSTPEQLPASDEGLPFERRGTVRVASRIDGPEGVSVTMEADYGFRCSLVVPPRPFGSPSLLVLAPEAVLEGATQTIDEYQAVIPEASSRLQELAGKLDEEGRQWAAVPGRVRQAVAEAIATFQGDTEAAARAAAAKVYPGDSDQQRRFAARLVANAGTEVDQFRAAVASRVEPYLGHAEAAGRRYQEVAGRIRALAAGFPEAPRPARFPPGVSLFSLDPELALAEVDLPALVQGPREEAFRSREELARALAALQDAWIPHSQARQGWKVPLEGIYVPAVPSIDVGALEGRLAALAEAAERVTGTDLATRVAALLQVFVDFQGRFQTFGGDTQAGIFRALQRCRASELLTRAHFTFGGPGAAEDATAFLDRSAPDAGVVVVGDDGVLRLDLGDVAGRLLVVALGDVEVRRARVRDPARHSITLVSYGSLTIQADEVDLSVLAFGPVERLPRRVLRGNLVLVNLDGLTGGQELQASLRYQEGLAGGERNGPDHAAVALDARRTLLSPAPRARRFP